MHVKYRNGYLKVNFDAKIAISNIINTIGKPIVGSIEI